MVRSFAHGAIDRRIDPSWWTHRANSCSTTGVTKAVLYCLWDDANQKVNE